MKTCSIQLNQLNFKNQVNLSKANYKICQADVSYESFSENREISNNISIYKTKPFSGLHAVYQTNLGLEKHVRKLQKTSTRQ